jgi:hypothetical protein
MRILNLSLKLLHPVFEQDSNAKRLATPFSAAWGDEAN